MDKTIQSTGTVAKAADTTIPVTDAPVRSAGASAQSTNTAVRGADATIRMLGPLEPRDGWVAKYCPIAGALEVLSARSAFLILREAFYGATRFDEFVRRAQISEPVAAARLRELVDAGLMEREDYRSPGQRTRQRYRLTEKGASLLPAMVALMQWGERWVNGCDRVQLRHEGCNAEVGVALRCEHGHDVSESELTLAVRPRPLRKTSLRDDCGDRAT
ncbi:MAG TPA: helix-turn-helix domain-containing protein [Solirubrobacteraceae bacterium]|jgi:DNA-binding HxlR family transcriptional regulator